MKSNEKQPARTVKLIGSFYGFVDSVHEDVTYLTLMSDDRVLVVEVKTSSLAGKNLKRCDAPLRFDIYERPDGTFYDEIRYDKAAEKEKEKFFSS